MGVTIIECEIPGVFELETDVFGDERGFFTELYNEAGLAEQGFSKAFVQDNLSCSSKGVLRGLHYQVNPHAQGKLVRCVRGSIIDVAVDIRVGAPTYGQYVKRKLSWENGKALYVPEGFAHGFLALEESTHVLYKCTANWAQGCEGTIQYDDPEIGIDWGAEPSLVNKKDLSAPKLAEANNNFIYEPPLGE